MNPIYVLEVTTADERPCIVFTTAIAHIIPARPIDASKGRTIICLIDGGRVFTDESYESLVTRIRGKFNVIRQ